VTLPLDQLEREAARLEREALDALVTGDAATALQLAMEARAVRAFVLQQTKRSGSVKEVTSQHKSRGLAISKARAKKKPKDAFKKALAAHDWSLRRYATHLGISPGQLVNYHQGVHPIPRRLAEKAARELGIPVEDERIWPAGLTD
jgi:hypothetical protein